MRGVKKLVLNSRRGITNSYQTLCQTKWKEFEDIQIVVCTEDSSDILKAQKLIKVCERLGPVGGKQQNLKRYFLKMYLL